MFAMLLVKATILIGLAALVLALARQRTSAATRHWVWTLAIVSLLLLPVAARAIPTWPIPVLAVDASRAHAHRSHAPAPGAAEPAMPQPIAPGAIGTGSGGDAPATAASTSANDWASILFGIYAAGAVLLALRLVAQQLAARRLLAGAEDVRDARWTALLRACADDLAVTRPVRLRRADSAVMPMATGIRTPAILLPSVADEWSEDRRRAVLRHELAHIRRHDCLTQLLAGAACAVYWVHPGAWWAARRLRVERELACDDLVLGAGTEARDYAGHLLDIAFSLGGHRAPAVAVSMARRGQLEGRMLAVLDDARNRAVPGRRGRLAGIAAAAAVVVPLAAAAAVPLAMEADPASPDEAIVLATAAPDASAPHVGETTASPAAPQEAGAATTGAGTWEIAASKTPGQIYLQLRQGRSSSGTTLPLSRLDGLTEAQMAGSGGPVRFSLRRDAGTFAFEGTFRSGVGGGTYAFTPNPAFPQELQKRGVGTPSAGQQEDMARHDVGLALVDELAAHGYQRPTVADLITAGHHGVRLEFVREMAQLGYRLGTVEALVRLRDHGVTPDYVRGMAAEGLPKMSADELVKTRDHGVTPEYAQQMRQLGYGNLGVEALVKARDHGVTPEFVKALADAGYRNLSLEQVTNARDHGVTPEFVRALGTFGYTKLSLEQVINARDHGVTPEFVKGLADLGYSNLALDEVINARDHGVTPDYARQLKALGYDNVPLAELVKLRDHGVTPERVKRANERAGTRLPLDMVRSLADGGMR